MNYDYSEVVVSIDLPSNQAAHGRYTHYHKIDREGKPVDGVRVEQSPSFCKCHKTINLSNEFVKGALSEPPDDLKDRYKLSFWRGLTENKRIALSVDKLVKSLHPEHRGYTMEVI